ncbi:MFS general substrate transporter, partial [Neolentinus lepideus HHB14362 ss-1]
DRREYDYTPEEVDAYELDPELSKSVCRAYDRRIMPVVFCMYLFSALDRGNLGNAKTDTLEQDLHLVGNQYNNVLTVLSLMFATMAIPGGYVTKRFGPPRMLPIYMLGWGAMAMINYGGIVAVRFFLGSFEGFFGPSVPIYLSSYYTRGELAKRLAIWYSSTAISGAFSGLLSYGIFQVKSSMSGWRILFLLEGGLTILVASIAMFILPSYPQYVKFLTPKQKEVAVLTPSTEDASKRVDAPFNAREFFAPAKEWKFYVFAIFALCYGTAQSTATTFLPQLIGRFGFSKVKTNLYTVAPNVAAALYLYLLAFLSDKCRQRTPFLALALCTTMIGSILLAALPLSAVGPGYFACFLIQCGAFVPTSLFHSWHNNNDPSENGRAFRTITFRPQLITVPSGFLTFSANAGSLISSNIFLDSWAPKYTKALIISSCLQVLGITIVLSMRTYMTLDNRKRNKQQGVNWTSRNVSTAVLAEGPKNPSFRHFL